jgi:hypothetical protein
MIAPLLRLRRAPIGSRRVLRCRGVKLDRFGLDGEPETFRHHADHRVRTAIQHEDTPNHIVSPIEMALPESVTENNLQTAGAAARLLICPGEAATKDRLDAEHVEEFAAHLFGTQVLRSLVVNQRDGAVPINRHARKALILFPKIGEVRKAQRVEPGRRSGLTQIDRPHGHQPVRFRKRQWL